jgi:FtsZ-interacting cell division protein ZipA
VSVARSMAEKLGGELVDDNRRPLTDAGVASLARTVEKVVQDMEAHGVPAGSALARRLFS